MATVSEKGAAWYKACMVQKETAGPLEPPFMEADAQRKHL